MNCKEDVRSTVRSLDRISRGIRVIEQTHLCALAHESLWQLSELSKCVGHGDGVLL